MKLKNCWAQLPTAVCWVGNGAGYVSSVIWFVVLLPQLYKNAKRKSVEGLSFAWAVANFSASLVNLFFVFQHNLPLFTKFSSIYMPTLEFLILCQFWKYAAASKRTRMVCSAGVAAFVCCIVAIEQIFSSSTLEWIAVVLWSVETFPQIALNVRLQSVEGQASASVFIAFCGKTCDSLSSFGLDMPLQIAIMTYFSTTSAFINCAQVVYHSMIPKHPVFGAGQLSVTAGLIVLLVLLLVWRTSSLLALFCPAAVVLALVGGIWLYRRPASPQKSEEKSALLEGSVAQSGQPV